MQHPIKRPFNYKGLDWDIDPAESNVGERRSLPVGTWLVEVQHHPRYSEVVATILDANRDAIYIERCGDGPQEMNHLGYKVVCRARSAWGL